ncbi:MAG: efflux RND transporter periplasmic adaptor subunit [Halobacteria archaeon]|nr:efflux RND transporter periplasmic adaptor subunit [Halobacteria archaeon]
MKQQYKVVITTILLSLTVAACGDKQGSPTMVSGEKQETAIEHAQKHLDPKYICPMHPQIVRDVPGSCPICGMDLVQVEAEEESSTGGERKILYYRHPHNPSITSDKPMQDEMGMDFIPIYDDRDGPAVKISPVVENNMGVRTARVTRDKLWRRIDTVGYVDFDENYISHIHLRTKGWIEKLYVKSEGERVTKGQLLFEVYSPDLVNAQEEYVQALNSGHKRLIKASKGRLVALGISEQQISEVRKSKQVSQYVRIYALQDGIIAKLSARDGMFVTPPFEIMTLADLSSVWLLAEVFESQADWVKVGQAAEVRLSYLPGQVWEGEVQYVYPSLNPKTRTLKVRLQFENPAEALKPNMFADVTIYGGAKTDIILIPREALIRTGQEERVILSEGGGRFRQRKVVAGIESGDWVQIVSGLEPGDEVVTSGQFLIDSEASLKASLARMSGGSAVIQESHAKVTKHIIGTGVLREIRAKENKVNMQHDPIPALGWPDMTMDFKIKPDVSLEGLESGDAVEFELEESDDGYVITVIQQRQQ